MTFTTLRHLTLAFGLAATASAQTPDDEWHGDFSADTLGEQVANVGDLDDDGTDDFAIATYRANRFVFNPGPLLQPDVGRVLIISGATGLALHDWYGDKSGEEFGYSVAGVGDMNGDGHDDVLIGIPLHEDLFGFKRGAVQLRSGASGAVLATREGDQDLARYGHAVAGSGGGVVPRAAVGAPHYNSLGGVVGGGFGEEGLVEIVEGTNLVGQQVFIGGERGLKSSILSGQDLRADARHFGWSLAYEGRYLAVGSPLSDMKNYTTLETISDTGYVEVRDLVAIDVIGDVGSVGAQFGTTVSISDLIPGGHPEVIVGSPHFPGGGKVEITTPFFDFPFSLAVSKKLDGAVATPIGDVVTLVDDFDGDGLEDIALGSPFADVGSPFALVNAGVVVVRSSATTGHLASFASDASGDRLGASVAAVKRVDGRVDLMVGVPGREGVLVSDAGAAYRYDSVDCKADIELYGHGALGTNGVPMFVDVTPPVLGEIVSFTITNSASSPTTAWLFLGFDAAGVPFKGGTLLVDTFASFPLPMPADALVLAGPLPDDKTFCGVSLFVQALLVDPGAVQGVAFTRGLELRLGL